MNWKLSHWPRLLGPLLLGVLLWQLGVQQVVTLLQQVALLPFVIAVVLNLPQLGIKALRWQRIMRYQKINYDTKSVLLAYFGSFFIGILTPGRLGEFVKTLHIIQDCQISSAKAFSSVLADRLFDLAILLLVAGAALRSLAGNDVGWMGVWILTPLLALPLVFFCSDTAFCWLQRWGLKLGHLGKKFFASDGWLQEVRFCLRRLTWRQLLVLGGLTVIAYAFFYLQCYLVAVAIGLPVGFFHVSCAVALGSLVTLLPISISGLGTREAAILAYLGTFGVSPEAALSFSLLVFVTFFIAGGMIGAVAWWLKPITLREVGQL